MLSWNAAYETWASQFSQFCKQQIDAAERAQFVVQEQHQEVLAVNSTLRRELDEALKVNEAFKQQLGEVRKENETYKQQFIQHTTVDGDDGRTELENKPPTKKGPADVTSTVASAISKTGLRKARGRRQGRGK